MTPNATRIAAERATLPAAAHGYFATLMRLPPEVRLTMGAMHVEPDWCVQCLVGNALRIYRGERDLGEVPYGFAALALVDRLYPSMPGVLEWQERFHRTLAILPNGHADWFAVYDDIMSWKSTAPFVEAAFACAVSLAAEDL